MPSDVDVIEPLAPTIRLSRVRLDEDEFDELDVRCPSRDFDVSAHNDVGVIERERQLEWDRICREERERIRQSELRYEYWNTDTPVKAIAALFGIKVSDVWTAAGAIQVGKWQCCGAPMMAKSRTERTGYMYYLAHESRVFCRECIARDHATRDAQRRREQAAQQARFDELHTMPYRDYLQTPEWQQLRAKMLNKAGYSCQVCNADGQLNVHHRTYERRGFEQLSDLIVLCRTCHALFHGQEQ